MERKVNTAIIGAGLTGLTTAYYLGKKSKSFIVLDKADRTGGVVSTKQSNGFLYEEGPNTGIIGTPEIAELFEDIKDNCKVIEANDEVNYRYILKDGKWEHLPSGLLEGLRTPLFSFKDKLRLLGEPFRKPGTDPHESLEAMVNRRMGKSFLEYAIDPFILGVYAGDPAYLVPKYALPKLYKLEQEYGSFIGGAIKKKFEKKDPRQKKATRKVFSTTAGLSGITDALYENAGKENFLLGVTEINVELKKNIYKISFKQQGNKNKVIYAKNLLSTIPAFELKNIFPSFKQSLIKEAANVYYAPVTEVAIGFNKWTGMPLKAFGGLIPFKENRDILGIMFMSSLFKGRAPENGALLSVFIGGARKPGLTSYDRDEVFKLLEKELGQLMGLNEFKPDLFEVFIHRKAIPQYATDSETRVRAIKDLAANYPGLYIGGNLCDGIGMADRVKQGRKLAEEIH